MAKGRRTAAGRPPPPPFRFGTAHRTLRAVLIYAGIDEAGYGPLLGPLCVAVAVVAIDDLDGLALDGVKAPDLWQRLRHAVSASPSERTKIAIADSKKLKGSKESKAHPLRHLERGVLAASVAAGRALPATDDELFTQLGIAVAGRDESPWYAEPTALPLAHDRDHLAIAANRLALAGREASVRFAHLACTALDGLGFNRLAASSQKSDMNLALALRHADQVWRAFDGTHPRIVIDRQGGRAYYREVLQTSFPEATIQILGETESTSRYRLEDRRGPITLSFEAESETKHLPTALASMAAKYARELHMLRMNRFFTGLLPELKPTAGYVEDGRRYLRDIRPALRQLGVREEQLVRSR